MAYAEVLAASPWPSPPSQSRAPPARRRQPGPREAVTERLAAGAGAGGPVPAFIDEYQLVPDILDALKGRLRWRTRRNLNQAGGLQSHQDRARAEIADEGGADDDRTAHRGLAPLVVVLDEVVPGVPNNATTIEIPPARRTVTIKPLLEISAGSARPAVGPRYVTDPQNPAVHG